MNTAIFISKNNKEGILKFANELAERQRSTNTGKVLILGAYYLKDDFLRSISEILADCHEVAEVVKVQVSENLPAHSQIATMIATFLMQRYTTVPGPWLIIDDYAEIVQVNPLSIIEKAHNASATENSGRASSPTDGGRIPVGPVVMSAPVKKIKSLRSVSGEDWRSRGRYALGICSWAQLPAEEYPFRFAPITENASKTVTDVIDLPVPDKVENAGKFDPPIHIPKSEKAEGFEPVKSEPANTEVPVESTEVEPPKPANKPFMLMDPTYYSKATKEELISQVWARTKKKPHHFTREPKLIEILTNLDKVTA